MLLKDRIAKELDRIRRQGNGLITREAVVEYARDPKTALHTQFIWDDTEAARRWRLEQAGNVLRLQVKVVSQDGAEVRTLVSLSTDRAAGGGYRPLEAVMNNEQLASVYLQDALSELNSARRKYGSIKQLAGVWAALEKVKATAKAPKPETATRAKGETRPAA